MPTLHSRIRRLVIYHVEKNLNPFWSGKKIGRRKKKLIKSTLVGVFEIKTKQRMEKLMNWQRIEKRKRVNVLWIRLMCAKRRKSVHESINVFFTNWTAHAESQAMNSIYTVEINSLPWIMIHTEWKRYAVISKWNWSQSSIHPHSVHNIHTQAACDRLEAIVWKRYLFHSVKREGGFKILNPAKWAECIYFYHFYYSYRVTWVFVFRLSMRNKRTKWFYMAPYML